MSTNGNGNQEVKVRLGLIEYTQQRRILFISHLDISMDNTELVTVLKGLDDLLDAEAGILLTVELPGHNIIKQFSSSDPTQHLG